MVCRYCEAQHASPIRLQLHETGLRHPDRRRSLGAAHGSCHHGRAGRSRCLRSRTHLGCR
ncbi:hypothetical protein ACFPRL_18180 [Pseudoclavibacter helvolus]